MDVENNQRGRRSSLQFRQRLGPELLDTLFAARLSTRSEASTTSGRGVGLASLRETCARLGAISSVETEDGAGTRFRVHLPFVARSTPDLATRAAAQ